MLRKLKTRLTKFIKSDRSTGYQLNYLTLHIESDEVRKDVYYHQLD